MILLKFCFSFGYIDFKHEESVRKAVELNNKVINGRKIFVVLKVFVRFV